MIEIKPNAFYKHEELRKMFAEDGFDWTWLRKVTRPKKIIGRGFWGRHIIDAIEAAKPSKERRHERDEADAVAVDHPKCQPRRRKPTLLDQVMRERVG